MIKLICSQLPNIGKILRVISISRVVAVSILIGVSAGCGSEIKSVTKATTVTPPPPKVQTTSSPRVNFGPDSWAVANTVNELVSDVNQIKPKNRNDFLFVLKTYQLRTSDLIQDLTNKDVAHAHDLAKIYLPDLFNSLNDLINVAVLTESEDAAVLALAKLQYQLKRWPTIYNCLFQKVANCL
jgi:hypothetical protein